MTRKGDKPASERRRFPVGQDPRRDARRERAEARQRDRDEVVHHLLDNHKVVTAKGTSTLELTVLHDEIHDGEETK